MLLSVATEPQEGTYACAAPQIAIPGRPEDVRTRLSDFVLAPDNADTTTPPIGFVETKPIGGDGGYPSWMLNEMIDLATGGGASKAAAEAEALDAERMAKMIKDKELAQKLREQYEAEQAKLADEAASLPEPSKKIMLNPRWPQDGAEVLAMRIALGNKSS